ncbi:TetR/AcrR family transcriptional regulator [Streptomyces sp. NPDC059452]|uniref:TetR/AcrR family transcriptional regulator n=1 Tax=Streptomyces sp. NPDC059452 TaxID=3346835 RepID=UPI00369FCA84
MTSPGPRPRRGRPPAAERPPLDRDGIARAALRIAGEEGFGALTMRRLAEELRVTPRALYNCVKDRQEVVDLTARLMMERLPRHVYDVDDWRSTIREVYRAAREQYRAIPRAALISLDEQVTPAEVHPDRLLHPEEMLAFLCAIGLGLEDAVHVRARLLLDVFAFTLLIDYRYDRSGEDVRALMQQPVPAPWLAAHPGLDVPHARAAAELPTLSSDAYFERFVDDAITLIEQRLRH